jgi:AraC-like DNA-binding protein
VADGIVELVFHYAHPFATSFEDRGWEEQPRSFLITQANHPIQIQPRGRVGFLSVRFYPWGAYHFFQSPAGEFADATIPAELVWKDRALRVEEQLALACGSRDRLRIVQDFLNEQLAAHERNDPNSDAVVRYVYHTRGAQTVSDLSKATGLTERTLERKLGNTVGMSPKHLSRIARFLGACQALRRDSERSLVDVALDLGYYDQAHLDRDFRQFAGVTPREFRARPDISHLELS